MQGTYVMSSQHQGIPLISCLHIFTPAPVTPTPPKLPPLLACLVSATWQPLRQPSRLLQRPEGKHVCVCVWGGVQQAPLGQAHPRSGMQQPGSCSR